ncbi:MAG: hypothetical protein Q9190_006080 [Brigantiaea leucoxantha]
MAALHTALQSLGPTDFSSVPIEETETKDYLQQLFAQAQIIIDSVPLPPPDTQVPTSRPRANTAASIISNASDLSSSSARSDPIDPSNVSLQKEWGKPIKLSPKENPLGPTTPRDFVTLLLTSSSALDHSNLTSSRSITPPSDKFLNGRELSKPAGHFIVISKPCVHPECPPRDGFIRGRYESVEFIREIPKKPKKSSSASDLLGQASSTHSKESALSLEKAALVQNAQQKLDQGESVDEILDTLQQHGPAPLVKSILLNEGRKRGKTISFAESRGFEANGEALNSPENGLDDTAEQNAVEWVMITRSDPGGSVPRFMVERGTPSGIVTDASKFIDWACKKEHPVSEDYAEEAVETAPEIDGSESRAKIPEAYQTSGHLAGIIEEAPKSTESSQTLVNGKISNGDLTNLDQGEQGGLLSSLADVAVKGIENYAPQAVVDQLPTHSVEVSAPLEAPSLLEPAIPDNNLSKADDSNSLVTTSSAASFASAEEHFSDDASVKSRSSTLNSPAKTNLSILSPQEKELAKFNERKKTLDERLAKLREDVVQNKEALTSKEEERVRKAEEKHARETAKQEARFRKEVSRLEAKRVKDAAKEAERKRKADDKDEKLKLTRERDEARKELDKMKEERELLREQVGALQRENTALVARVGKLEMGKLLLGEVQKEVQGGGAGARSRSSSLRKGRESGSKELEATVTLGNGARRD